MSIQRLSAAHLELTFASNFVLFTNLDKYNVFHSPNWLIKINSPLTGQCDILLVNARQPEMIYFDLLFIVLQPTFLSVRICAPHIWASFLCIYSTIHMTLSAFMFIFSKSTHSGEHLLSFCKACIIFLWLITLQFVTKSKGMAEELNNVSFFT